MESTEQRPWARSYAPGCPWTSTSPTSRWSTCSTTSVGRFGPLVALDFFGATTTLRRARATRSPGPPRRCAASGVGKGDRVALVLPNCPQNVIAFYAALRLGAVVVEHNPLYTERRAAPPARRPRREGRRRLGQGRRRRSRGSADRPRRRARRRRSTSPTACRRPSGSPLRLPMAKAREARARDDRRPRPAAPGGSSSLRCSARRPAGPARRGPGATTSRCCSTPAARPGSRRARCSPTATS